MHHLGPIAGIAAHGDWIATAGYDNRLILWDGRRREALARACHDHLVNQCAFSPDGRWLVSASSDYSARVWALPSLRLQTVLGPHGDDVDMAVFSPDSQRIATCALDRCVRIFDLQGRCLQEMHGHQGNVLSLAWAADGKSLVSSSVDGSLRIWDAQTGQALQCIALAVRSDSVEMSADGRLYAGDDFGRIAIFDAGELSFVQAHRAGVKKIALDAAQGRLVSLSYDRSMAVWEIDAQGRLREISRCEMPACIWARAATVLPDGRVATGTFGSSYALYEPHSGEWDLDAVVVGPGINAVLEHQARVWTVGDAGLVQVDGQPQAEMGSLCNFLVAAGAQVFTGGQLGQLFDAHSGQLLYQHHSPLNCGVAFEREGHSHLAVGSYTGEMLVFELLPGQAPQWRRSLKLFDNAVKGLSAGNDQIFAVCASSDVAWISVAELTLQRYLSHAHERIANACCALPETGSFASVSRDRQLRLWSDDAVQAYASPHPNSVKCMAADSAGKTLLTGSYGGTLALFCLEERRWTRLTRPTTAGISSISWDRHAQRYLAASYDGHVYPVSP